MNGHLRANICVVARVFVCAEWFMKVVCTGDGVRSAGSECGCSGEA